MVFCFSFRVSGGPPENWDTDSGIGTLGMVLIIASSVIGGVTLMIVAGWVGYLTITGGFSTSTSVLPAAQSSVQLVDACLLNKSQGEYPV